MQIKFTEKVFPTPEVKSIHTEGVHRVLASTKSFNTLRTLATPRAINRK